jgi:hypothetical protein
MHWESSRKLSNITGRLRDEKGGSVQVEGGSVQAAKTKAAPRPKAATKAVTKAATTTAKRPASPPQLSLDGRSKRVRKEVNYVVELLDVGEEDEMCLPQILVSKNKRKT